MSEPSKTPITDAYPTKLVERSIDEALHPKGMSTHDGMVKLACDHVLKILARSRSLELALREKDEQDKEALPRTPSELTETQDAERYRWLRKHGVYIVRDDSPHEGEAKWCHNELADAAIDARMKEES